ncbi:hypothetical protein Tco_1338273 [Tanacetum coccineum]
MEAYGLRWVDADVCRGSAGRGGCRVGTGWKGWRGGACLLDDKVGNVRRGQPGGAGIRGGGGRGVSDATGQGDTVNGECGARGAAGGGLGGRVYDWILDGILRLEGCVVVGSSVGVAAARWEHGGGIIFGRGRIWAGLAEGSESLAGAVKAVVVSGGGYIGGCDRRGEDASGRHSRDCYSKIAAAKGEVRLT